MCVAAGAVYAADMHLALRMQLNTNVYYSEMYAFNQVMRVAVHSSEHASMLYCTACYECSFTALHASEGAVMLHHTRL